MAKTKKWEVNMHEARELRKKGAGLLYDRVALLIACYDDGEFRAWHEANGTNELDFLDEELSDTAVGFLSLKAVMASNPNREDWIKHNVRDLIATTMAAEAEGKKRDRDDTRISWKERALAAEAECERLRAKVETMTESMMAVASAKCS